MNQTQTAEKIYNIHQIHNADFGDKKKLHFPTIPKPDYFIGRDDLLADIHQRLQLLSVGICGKVEVPELSPAEAMNLFQHYYPTESDLLPKLLEKIYHHTLMIELIAKAGKKKRLSIEQLLARLESGLSHQDLQRVITVGSHADSQLKEKQAKLYQYILAMFEPEELDEEKQRILRYFSVLPAEAIPLAHLKTLFAVEDENQFEDDLESLFQSGLGGIVQAKKYRFTKSLLFGKTNNKCLPCINKLSPSFKNRIFFYNSLILITFNRLNQNFRISELTEFKKFCVNENSLDF
ncbi:MAG: hypothetical protein KAI83_15450 [Thiomargarita sp.]|nr:hypothetical protein [Thiomargarita sp.]